MAGSLNPDMVLLGNPKSQSVVCCLWTPKKVVAARLPASGYFALGNLYSIDGINGLLRSLLANPKCRFLLVAGHDMSGSGKALVSFFQGKKGQFQPDSGLPAEAIKLVRENVRLIDMRGRPLAKVGDKLKLLAGEKLPPYAKPGKYPLPAPVPVRSSLPSEGTAFLIRHGTIASGWLQALDLVMKFGALKPTEYGVKMKEILNLVAVIDEEDEAPLASYFPFTRKDLDAYLPTILSAERPAAISYTYGSRLFSREDSLKEDQVSLAIRHLRKAPHTRRAIAFTWRVHKDAESDHPPCLTQIVWNVQGGKLFQTVIFRSHDIFSGWPMNLLALRKLQAKVAKGAGVPAGPLTCVSNSAHVYEDKFPAASAVLNKHYHHRKLRSGFTIDPRGSFVIRLDRRKGGLLRVDHYDTARRRTGYSFQGRAPQELLDELLNENLVSRLDHAAYLGRELERAFQALESGKTYVQDEK